MSKTIHYFYGAQKPDLGLWLYEDSGKLYDFSDPGYSFSFRIGHIPETALIDKTSGITGATGSGREPDGEPNVSVAWAGGELTLDPGIYDWNLIATLSGGEPLIFGGIFVLGAVMS